MKNWKETDKQTVEYHRKIAVLAVAGICLLTGSPVMTAETEDLTLEQALFGEKAEFFEEVYSIRPVLKAKRM